ncbi:coiled-coil domain-containing protein 63-like [Anabrus simplex]|uniref:coiled-coil domain-containing protein 63-like n=1 Tax=Anabrus simplex TaxID=316456 RepID=UPI0035A38F44
MFMVPILTFLLSIFRSMQVICLKASSKAYSVVGATWSAPEKNGIPANSQESHELEHQIRKVEKDVLKMRMKDVTDLQSKERAIEARRNIAILENRLHLVTVRFNEMLTQNAELRNQISHLLKERTHFNHLYQQLIVRLNSGKKVMLDLIEQATIAYDQREEAQNKLQVLKERGRQDLHIHSQEMRELQRKLDHDMKLQEFLGVKGQRRVLTDLEAREAWKKQHHREETERLIAKYEGILDQIREFCGEDDLDRLAARFVKQEEENFALFTYVNELNNETGCNQDEKNKFLEDLEETISEEKAIIIGDHNAQLGTDRKGYEKVMGSHGYGRRNSEAEHLLDFCIRNCLIGKTVASTKESVEKNNQMDKNLPHIKRHNVLRMLQGLQDDVEELRRNIDGQRALEELRREEQESKLNNLQDKLYNIRTDIDVAEDRLALSNRMMTNMLNGIERMFHLIRCDSTPLLDLLGPNSHTTTYNVLLFLSIIERRTIELLNTVFFLQKKAEGEEWEEEPPAPVLKEVIPTKLRPVAIGVMTPTQPCVLCVEQGEIEAVEEMDEIDVFPFTREDAKQKLLEQLDRPGFEDRLHNVSACRLPRSRRMLQHRFE